MPQRQKKSWKIWTPLRTLMNKSIQFKFTALFVIIFSLLSLGTSLRYTQHHYSEEIRQMTEKGDFITRVQSYALEYPLWNFSKAQIKNVIEVLKEDPHFVGAYVYDPKGKVIESVGKNEASEYILKFEYFIIHDKGSSKENLGTLATYFTKEKVLQDHLVFFLSVLLIVFAIGTVIVIALRQIFAALFAKPLQKIVDTMKKVSGGDLNQTITLEGNDEFATVASVFNTMIAQLRDTYATIEEKVRMRTAELSMSNGALEKSKKVSEIAFAELKVEKARSERLLVDALEMSPSALLLLDQNQSILMWNEQLVDIYPEVLEKALVKNIDVGDAFEKILIKEAAGIRQKGNLADILLNAPKNIESIEVLLENNKWIQVSQHQTKDKEYVVMFLDITELKSREKTLESINVNLSEQTEKLRVSEERYALASLGSNDGVWDWNIETNEVQYSERFKEMLGEQENKNFVTLEDWFERIHPEQRDDMRRHLNEHLKGESPRFKYEFQIKHADGSYKWFLVRGMVAFNEVHSPVRIAGSLTDITIQKSYEQELWHTAYHDALTGLANRSLFVETLRQILSDGLNPVHTPAILFLDLDRFKMINDSLGHDVGDKLLVSVARRLKRCIRHSDIAARLGGDEFTVILLEATSHDEVKKVAERILAEFTRPFNLDGNEVYVTSSIGVAYLDGDTKKIDTFLRNADLAMYRAKNRGRACYEVFDKEFHDSVMKELQVETDLRQALKKDYIKLFYQPIIHIETNKIVGFEGLVRWEDPETGMVPLNLFLPVAEETGLILPLGEQVLMHACEQISTWRERYPDVPLSVAVNLSVKQLRDKTHMNHLINILSSYAFPKGTIKIEITESVLMDNPEASLGTLNRLKELNIELSIDDFGTGYSSFSYLYKFPFDVLKIDQAFTGKMFETEKNYRLVRGIVGLAHDLGLKVVAEGVEEEAQLDHLKKMGCDYAQGYLFSKPVRANEATALLEKQFAPVALERVAGV